MLDVLFASLIETIKSPIFGITLTIFTYFIGKLVNSKLKNSVLNSIFNPIIVSVILVITVLKVFNIPMEYYQNGGEIIAMFLVPATAVLAYTIYAQIELLKKYFIPVVVGSLVGALTSVFSVIYLCKAFGLSEEITWSLFPKSVTVPIAAEISTGLGGIPSITVLAVSISGITGCVFAPLLIKLFRVKRRTAAGVAIGTCSHGLGTSKALEIGEVEGAMSGISIGITGILTVIISLFFQLH